MQNYFRIVDATQNHDTQTSKVLGNELAEVRKVTKIFKQRQNCFLEQIELRLTTCSDLGDTVVAIMPTMGLMKNLKSSWKNNAGSRTRDWPDGRNAWRIYDRKLFRWMQHLELMKLQILNLRKSSRSCCCCRKFTGQMFPSVPTFSTGHQLQTQTS